MTRTTESLTPELYEYLVAQGTPVDGVLADLVEETARLFPESKGMQIGPEQGTFTTLLTRISGARDAVEIGTFTGYSSICLARGLPEDGTLLALDVSDEWTSVARRYWERAGVADRITLRLGPALETLRSLPAEARFDLAFIDADKEGYVDYWEELVPRMRAGGILLADNTLSHGRVVDGADTTARVQGIRDFNARLVADDRVTQVLLPIGDGLTLARKN
ncbi:O-methyltransferase [Nocardiopsis changdeensis]|uniref:Class I SAM-dependent methyltransferase n=1 Tax=Nocardiopsis changdeensis TaxID=2831969 RepID=A0ABX8BKR9_9ACTN|nr:MULTISPECIES: class I SAM-dependent methyltransferase [Nocardiopsis]QUX21486.1 class I SAM-dependent methyltransferase [Nocardiopsis changdeensis]QYX37420.1 class I SAM-dependent methyltransferase [Nocardiopsis sp. MT53]